MAACPNNQPILWSARERMATSPEQEMPAALVPPGWRGALSSAGPALVCDRDYRCLSSAVVNGGFVCTRGFLNMHLREDGPLHPGGPEVRLAEELRARALPADSVAMMTGASMCSFRLASARLDGHLLTVALTAGLSNARRAGDRAEQRSLVGTLAATGTINLALVSSVPLTPAAMAETLTTLTEAKAAVLQTLGIISPLSGGIATGTGTDATAVFCPPDGDAVAYAGKHTLFGESAARLVAEALTDSLAPAGEAVDAG